MAGVAQAMGRAWDGTPPLPMLEQDRLPDGRPSRVASDEPRRPELRALPCSRSCSRLQARPSARMRRFAIARCNSSQRRSPGPPPTRRLASSPTRWSSTGAERSPSKTGPAQQFVAATGVDMTPIEYKRAASAIADLVAGRIVFRRRESRRRRRTRRPIASGCSRSPRRKESEPRPSCGRMRSSGCRRLALRLVTGCTPMPGSLPRSTNACATLSRPPRIHRFFANGSWRSATNLPTTMRRRSRARSPRTRGRHAASSGLLRRSPGRPAPLSAPPAPRESARARQDPRSS